MPCITDDYRSNPSHIAKLEQAEAVLCAVCTRLQEVYDAGQKKENIFSSALLDGINWKEAGVTKEWAVNWRNEHRRKDAEKREKERAAKELEEKVKAAKAKLTQEEIQLLGIK